MTIAYFDCFAGAGGDMILAALLDAGLDLDDLRRPLGRLGLGGWAIEPIEVVRRGLRACQLGVTVPHEHHHRRLGDIREIIEAAELPPAAADLAGRIFHRLAEAEARVHGCRIEEVHFHEVGAVDSILDIVGAAVAVEAMGIERVVCSPLPLGSGWIETAHGRLPVPAPATADLLCGLPTCPGEAAGELTTPTAAAILGELADSFGPPPAMTLTSVGYGAGTREPAGIPGLLRVMLGEACDDGEVDAVVELTAHVDDCTGEVLGATIGKLIAAGCLDAWATPAFTKKGRPSYLLSALCEHGDVDEAERILFTETTTFGLRRVPAQRRKLRRRHETVETPFGSIRIKVGTLDGRDVTASPEFADCLDAAESHGRAVRDVLEAARAAWRERQP